MRDPWEEEEDALIQQYEDGEISRAELDRELKEMRRAYTAMVEEEAERAAEDVRERYYR